MDDEITDILEYMRDELERDEDEMYWEDCEYSKEQARRQ